MKTYQNIPTYPLLRRSFKSYTALGNVINRSPAYIKRILAGPHEFSEIEKVIILRYLGISPEDPEAYKYFMKGGI